MEREETKDFKLQRIADQSNRAHILSYGQLPNTPRGINITTSDHPRGQMTPNRSDFRIRVNKNKSMKAKNATFKNHNLQPVTHLLSPTQSNTKSSVFSKRAAIRSKIFQARKYGSQKDIRRISKQSNSVKRLLHRISRHDQNTPGSLHRTSGKMSPFLMTKKSNDLKLPEISHNSENMRYYSTERPPSNSQNLKGRLLGSKLDKKLSIHGSSYNCLFQSMN